MAGKVLMMGPSPGTGLFAHEPARGGDRERGAKRNGYARQQPTDAGTKLAQVEEERVNTQLVGILERKVNKMRDRAEAAEEKLGVVEAKMAKDAEELEELRRRVEERDQQVADLCAAHQGFAEDQRAAAQTAAALRGAESGLGDAQRALHECQRDLAKQRDGAASAEAEWKDQIVKLVAGEEVAKRRVAELEAELHAARDDKARLTQTAQEVVCRYEEESARRLELEERLFDIEEKSRARDERVRGDLGAAQEKAKQSLQAKQRAEAIAQQRDGKERQALQRVEELEARCTGLESEVQRLRATCAERAKKIRQLEEEERPRSDQATTRPTAMVQKVAVSGLPPSRIPAPSRQRPSSGSRPGTAASVASAASGGNVGDGAALCDRGDGLRCFTSLPADSGASACAAERGHSSTPIAARRPPGAIRRAGSVPTRGGVGHHGHSQSLGSQASQGSARSYSPSAVAAVVPATHQRVTQASGSHVSGQMGRGRPPSLQQGATAAVAPSRQGQGQSQAQAEGKQQFQRAGPASRDSSEDDLQIADTIPSEPDDSSDEEVLSPVIPKGR
mmetsp:Transcript_97096/g.274456  ORF Transcript_97096/g.274456 Transcript_97096/m.274456 type:complete len:562 (+) Transcript_97096:98-1783(+)